MLPNAHHPGPRCSCEDCQRAYPGQPQFTRQASRPLTTPSYHLAARRVRDMADTIDRTAARQTPQERVALTRAIHVLLDVARVLNNRHHGRNERKPHDLSPQ